MGRKARDRRGQEITLEVECSNGERMIRRVPVNSLKRRNAFQEQMAERRRQRNERWLLEKVVSAFQSLETIIQEDVNYEEEEQSLEFTESHWDGVNAAYRTLRSILLQENEIPESAVVSESEEEQQEQQQQAK